MVFYRQNPSPDCSENPFLKKKIAAESRKQLQKKISDKQLVMSNILLLQPTLEYTGLKAGL